MMNTDHKYMYRCLQLARQGAGQVAPNPMVGAVLVHQGRIIGEGFHQRYGGPHAEVHCINSVQPEHLHLISESTLYVSLEPCAHHGKTPPCSDLIIAHQIPHVVIGCSDPFEAVNGKGIDQLRAAGIRVTTEILHDACRELNRSFFTFHESSRPYIILKWAQTANGFMAAAKNTSAHDGQTEQNGSERLRISNEYSDRLVHQWRSEVAAIMVGTQTAIADDPKLTTRLWKGKDPVRIVLDLHDRLPKHLHVLDGTVPTIVLTRERSGSNGKVTYHALKEEGEIPEQISKALHGIQLQSVLIEGGAMLLQSFINAGLFDEIRVITNTKLTIDHGLRSPQIPSMRLHDEMRLASDDIRIYHRIKTTDQIG